MNEEKQHQVTGSFKQIDLTCALELSRTTPDAIILDVRTKEEYDMGHLENAVLLPYDQIPALANNILPNKDTPILIYCRAGRRSVIAAHYLVHMGYTRIYEFGGLTLWREYELVTPLHLN